MDEGLKEDVQTEKRNYTRALKEAIEVQSCIQGVINALDCVTERGDLGEVLSTFGTNGSGSLSIQYMQEAIDGELELDE